MIEAGHCIMAGLFVLPLQALKDSRSEARSVSKLKSCRSAGKTSKVWENSWTLFAKTLQIPARLELKHIGYLVDYK